MTSLGINTSELVDSLLGIVRAPAPARVRVTPNGRANWYGKELQQPILSCEDGFSLTCSVCGALPQSGNRPGKPYRLLGTYVSIGRSHLRREHAA